MTARNKKEPFFGWRARTIGWGARGAGPPGDWSRCQSCGREFGTIAIGIDHERLTYRYRGLDQRLTGPGEARAVEEVLG